MYRSLFLVLFSWLICAAPARAWDKTGHEVIAYIAWQQMTPEARAAVIALLEQASPRSGLPALDGRTDLLYFLRASTWPDVVRDRRMAERYDRYHHGAWHYTNIFWEKGPDGEVHVREDLKPEPINIVERIAHLDDVAGNDFFAAAQRALAIAWLEHLVGDLHQPLHTSARVTEQEPEGDRGGNTFQLGGRDNLHWYWDSILTRTSPQRAGESETTYVARLAGHITATHPVDTFDLLPGDYDAWARRGFEIASHDVYQSLERGEAPSETYQEKTRDVAEEAVALAGYRLGQMMNQLFGT